MTKDEIKLAYTQAMQWVQEAGDYLRQATQEGFSVNHKADAHDLVTTLDIEIEERLSQAIRRHYPEHRICGEESQSSGATQLSELAGAVWFIDPIDGTINFVKQQRDFGIMLALYIDGKAQFGIIYDVMRDDFYHAFCGEGAYLNRRRIAPPPDAQLADSLVILESGAIKRNDSLSRYALEHCLSARVVGSTAILTGIIAGGRAAAFISMQQMPWDIAPAIAILGELNIRITQHDGSPMSLLQGENCLIAQEQVHQEMLR